jgi:hypothetical protein
MEMEGLPRARWRKSSHSGTNGECVEVAGSPDGDHVFVRNTRDRSGGTLDFTPAEWDAFLAGVRDGVRSCAARQLRGRGWQAAVLPAGPGR